jgi:hypothetical protein
MIQFGMRGKLTLAYIGSFEVIGKTGLVSYRLMLHAHLARIHNAFHVSLLWKANVNLA